MRPIRPRPAPLPVRPLRAHALFVALIALAGCNRQHAAQYRTDSTDRGAIVEQVSATGDVEAIVSVNIGSQVSGTISKLYVDFNSVVKKGQLLADIDPRVFKAALERAEAGLAAARANVAKAQAMLDDATRQEKRARDLLAQQLDSQADVDTAMSLREQDAANLLSTKAAVLQAKADRDTAAANLVFTHIVSPIDGVVISRTVDVGVTVAASMTVATLFTIANDLTKMQILANIDEADVGKVLEGLPARFSVDAWPGEEFIGTIREVRQSPNTINNVVTYAAVIDAPNPKRKLKPGMTASVQITTAHRESVVRVPNAALRFKPSAPLEGAPRDSKDRAEKSDAAPTAREGAPRPVGERGQWSAEDRARWASGDHPHHRRDDAQSADGGTDAADLKRADASDEPKQPSRSGRLYKLVEGKPQLARVRLGLQDSQHTEVLEGIGDGETVIVGEIGTSQSAAPASLMGGQRPPGGGGGRH